jgi:hypothetical protein
VPLAKDENVFQGMSGRLIKTGDAVRWKGMWKKTKVMRISREPSPLRIMTDQKQLENMEYFKYFGCTITNDTRCTRKTKSELPWQKQHSTGRRIFSPANWT